MSGGPVFPRLAAGRWTEDPALGLAAVWHRGRLWILVRRGRGYQVVDTGLMPPMAMMVSTGEQVWIDQVRTGRNDVDLGHTARQQAIAVRHLRAY